MQDAFRMRLDAAREWERALATWLAGRGWYILPTYDYGGEGEDKAPKLMAPVGKNAIVLPDLLCFRAGREQWCECKWKACADTYRRGGYRVTGISLRLLREYERVEKATQAEVVLAFLHDREQEIRGATLARLKACYSHTYSGPMMSRGGMIFWRYDKIPRWGSLARLQGAA